MSDKPNSGKKQIPIVEGAFTSPSDEPHLIVNKCRTCGTVSFPKSPVCINPRCENKTDVEEALLARQGHLLTYTQVCYPLPPPFVSPDPFIPFAIGEVQFPEGIAIMGQLTGCQYEDLKIGMEVEVVLDSLYEDKEGNEVVAWKFRPV